MQLSQRDRTISSQLRVANDLSISEGASNSVSEQPLQTRVSSFRLKGCTRGGASNGIARNEESVTTTILISDLEYTEVLVLIVCTISDRTEGVNAVKVTSTDRSCCNLNQSMNTCLYISTVLDTFVTTS